jgi:glycosyltransferase involved in cell wall biosynthesis
VEQSIFICQVFFPDGQATSQLFSDLFTGLAGRGFQTEILAGYPSGGMAGVRCPRRERWEGVLIRRGGLRIDAKRNLLARGMGYCSYCLWVAWRLVFFTPASARILVTTNPPFAPIIVYLCSRLRGWRYDVMLLDIYPDGLVQLGRMHDGSIMTSLWRSLNRRAWMAAGRVQVLGRDMAQLCRSKYAIPEAKLAWTPHWSSVAVAARRQPEATALWRRLGLGGLFVVQYSGNMGLWHDMEALVRAADILRGDSRIRFLMIGDGRRRAAAEELSRELQLENVTWLPFQPKEQLEDSLACCHAAIISQHAGLEGIAVPCKLYGILAAGRAVLAQVPAGSEAALVVKEENCGLCIEPGDIEGLAQAIKELASNHTMVEEMGRRAFVAYEAKYSLQFAVDTFQQLLTGSEDVNVGKSSRSPQ